ncbi:MAG: hypothetical protein GY810_15990 [Aureispira sp.]|nr:hypothetical protein [Aureispira sp.]
MGSSAGQNNTTGQGNVYIGRQAGLNSSSALRNVFIGMQTGSQNTTGNFNTFVGGDAGYGNTTGQDNVFLGQSAGGNNGAGNYNIAIGREAGSTMNGASELTFIGYRAGRANTTGTGNTFLGFQTGAVNTTGSSNTFLGHNTGIQNTIGSGNTFIGQGAGTTNTTGTTNTFLGNGTGFSNSTGARNTFLGQAAGFRNTTGINSTFLGWEAGRNNTTGQVNVFLGAQAGYNNTTGNGNLFIGTTAGYNETGSNKLYIDNSSTATPIIWGELQKDSLVFNADVNIGGNYVLPIADGTNGQVMTTDGAGTVTWASASSGMFERDATNGDIQPSAAVTIATDDFVFGSTQLNNAGGTDDDKRFFFDKSKAAFRTGEVTGTEWDAGAVGDHTFAAGLDLRVQGRESGAFGKGNIIPSNTINAFSYGLNNTLQNANFSMVGGNSNSTNAYNTVITGGTRNHIAAQAQGSGILSGQNDSINKPLNQGAGIFCSSIAGGYENEIRAARSFIGGGSDNLIQFSTNPNYGYSSILGGSNNDIQGASWATVAGGANNRIGTNADYTVIGAGQNNQANGTHSVLGGGSGNIINGAAAFLGAGSANYNNGSSSFLGAGFSCGISGNTAVICGGSNNLASADQTFVGGGISNVANGTRSVNLGSYTNNNSNGGCFIFGDNSTAIPTQNTAANQFMVRAAGGTIFYSNAALTSGVQLAAGGGAWAAVSDVNKKENFQKVDGEEVLAKIANMDIQEWNYITQEDAIRHMGPTAQDFHTAFGLGESDTTITTVDIDGVNLLAVQTLEKRTQELKNQNTNLQTQLSSQANEIAELKALLTQQTAELEEKDTKINNLASLEARLAAIEMTLKSEAKK